ncbi:MAG: hypothetical protein MUF64_02565 [Polyangiaceae bacterium]|nr:hypothetical protein [Polyangiaceae bacterium]
MGLCTAATATSPRHRTAPVFRSSSTTSLPTVNTTRSLAPIATEVSFPTTGACFTPDSKRHRSWPDPASNATSSPLSVPTTTSPPPSAGAAPSAPFSATLHRVSPFSCDRATRRRSRCTRSTTNTCPCPALGYPTGAPFFDHRGFPVAASKANTPENDANL